MTLPSSGALSMSAINAEFGRGNNLNAYRGTTWYTDAGGSGTFSSGAISMSEFYGKRATSPRVSASYTFSSNTQDASLNVSTLSGYVAGQTDITITVNSGVYLWASSVGTYGLNLVGGAAGDVITLVNAGYIMGKGGTGSASNAAGTAGGPALNTPVALKVNNTGYIGGGGGGGGQGGTNLAPGGGGAGGGTGGYWSGYSSGQPGGTIGTSGGTAPNTLYGGGGGGGRIMPGLGGAGASASVGNAGSYGSSSVYGGSGGGAGGGGSCTVSSLNTSGAATGGNGGAAGATGGTGSGSGTHGAGGGGGGWGANGGSYSGTQTYAPGAGGKAINTNGNTVVWLAGQTQVYGSVS